MPVPSCSRRRALTLLVTLPWLAACGGGADNPFQVLYTWITIDSLDAPSDADKNAEVKVEAHAASFGEISDGDINWDLNQTDGYGISNLSEERADGNHKVTYRFTTPDHADTLDFEIRVKANGFSDLRRFSLRVS